MRDFTLAPLAAALALAWAPSAPAAEAAPKIQRLAVEGGPNAEAGRYPPEMVAPGQTGFDGSFLATPAYKDAGGTVRVQIWESGPGVLRTEGYPYDEYCLVLEGRLEIENAAGGRESFGPGDTFVIPKGWRGTWNMKTRFRKQYVALTQPDGATSN